MNRLPRRFSIPKTPESRTPSVVIVLVIAAAVLAVARGLWRLLAGSPFGAEMVIVGAAGGVLYAVWRFRRGERAA
jgi:hypothetical protein